MNPETKKPKTQLHKYSRLGFTLVAGITAVLGSPGEASAQSISEQLRILEAGQTGCTLPADNGVSMHTSTEGYNYFVTPPDQFSNVRVQRTSETGVQSVNCNTVSSDIVDLQTRINREQNQVATAEEQRVSIPSVFLSGLAGLTITTYIWINRSRKVRPQPNNSRPSTVDDTTTLVEDFFSEARRRNQQDRD